ncbi:hypothetical protein N7466_003589 [Penicillium verhagenii]|uniref:uncharacterized protein n=1 Tax=Penicillium verhagenii TaxID=1562060 RepID=UPI00254555EF|nr:uncharacterized protein N7466_003589 [Penicillium verhagenii]KAJ5934042.1 hypothetical protein N7466_003589 [Penicillium verhagenii]
MRDSLYDRLWRRECGDLSARAGVRDIYGSKEWVGDLDIVNQLGGHTGCVNALSWSRSGRLLASGSDDQHLNIYSYQPESSDAPFALNTTVRTGHKANIFSVKFMPHSNDRTLVTCAGDSQVRVFDIEYSSSNGNVAATSAFAASARSRRFNNFFEGARYLSEGNTNARVYRSHADRVKRIVVESSPYLFLTCSEDGEVRQWDLRQPASTYPPPNGGQGFMAYRPGQEHDDSNVPPPLISYKKFNLDLNTISCSPSQPHYIALGGAHMHCFLHDRRMLGRDMMAERGTPSSSIPTAGTHDDELMGKATRCVRRFAPRGKHRVRHLDDGHITACKISDANPDEMVVSWSGDHIYSFDLIQSPDARVASPQEKSLSKATRKSLKDGSQDRKRKRPKPMSMSSQESEDRHHSRRRSNDLNTLRVRFENGESSDIPIAGISEDSPENMLEHARYSVLNDEQRTSRDISKGMVKLRRAMFSLEETIRTASNSDDSHLAPDAESFRAALTIAATILPQMDSIMREWRYPMNPSHEVVAVQQTLRHHRQESWRFIQAAGTLAFIMKNSSHIAENGPETYPSFQKIIPAPSEDESIEREAQFGYDFLKAILLWFQGGRQDLFAGFKRGSCHRRQNGRFPIEENDAEDAIERVLIPYLHTLAADTPIVNVDASPYEHDRTRILFQTQRAAVIAFGNAVKLPLENLGTTAARIDTCRLSNSSSHVRSLDRASAFRFWALRVGRGVLLTTGKLVDYAFVNRAFGGLQPEVDESDSDLELERYLEESQEDINLDDSEERLRSINLINAAGSNGSVTSSGNGPTSSSHQPYVSREALLSSESSGDEGGSINNEIDEFDESDQGDIDQEDPDEWTLGFDDDSEEESDTGIPVSLRSGGRRRRRRDVEINAPCSSHTKVYRGHCNIKTVKDVNFFGLNDEYVVSGSDSGHVFMWDRKTGNLVNILEGDTEVVNVVQGHPYEPTMAVSGIDNTIKIFNPDQNAQEQARQGINILDPDNPKSPLLGGLSSRKRLHDSYRIINQNDVERRGGMSEAHITRSMLTRLAATIRGRQSLGEALGEGIEGLGGQGGEGATVVLDENCLVM